MNPNYLYVFERALALAGKPSPRVLDYGCGRGEVVTYGRSLGYEFFGTDRDAPPEERPVPGRAGTEPFGAGDQHYRRSCRYGG